MASADGKRGRFFWSDLNQFCRDFISTQGRRPDRDALARAYEEHKQEWFVAQGKPVPSLEDVCRQAKGVRLLNEQRQYMAQYRREKKAKQTGGMAAASSETSEEGTDGMEEEHPPVNPLMACMPMVMHVPLPISQPNSNSAPSSQTTHPPQPQLHLQQPGSARARRQSDGSAPNSAQPADERPAKRRRASADGGPAASAPDPTTLLPPSSLDLLMAAACADAGTPGTGGKPQTAPQGTAAAQGPAAEPQPQPTKQHGDPTPGPLVQEPANMAPEELHALLMDQLQALANCSLKLKPPAPVLTTSAGATLPAHQLPPMPGAAADKLKPTITSCGPATTDMASHMAAMRRRRGSSSGGSSIMSLGEEAAELLQQAAGAALGLHLLPPSMGQGAQLGMPYRRGSSGGGAPSAPLPADMLAEMQAVSAAAAAALAAATGLNQHTASPGRISQPNTARSNMARGGLAYPSSDDFAAHPFRTAHPSVLRPPAPAASAGNKGTPAPGGQPGHPHSQLQGMKLPIPEPQALAPAPLPRRSSAATAAPLSGSVPVPPPVTGLPPSAPHYHHPAAYRAPPPHYPYPPPPTHTTVVHHHGPHPDQHMERPVMHGHPHAQPPPAAHRPPSYPSYSHMPPALPPGLAERYPPGTIVTVHRLPDGSEHIVVHPPGSSPAPYPHHAHHHHPPMYPHAHAPPPPPPYPYPAYHGERPHEMGHHHHPGYGYPPVNASHHHAAYGMGHPHSTYSYPPSTPPYSSMMLHGHHADALMPPPPPSVVIQEASPTPSPAPTQPRQPGLSAPPAGSPAADAAAAPATSSFAAAEQEAAAQAAAGMGLGQMQAQQQGAGSNLDGAAAGGAQEVPASLAADGMQQAREAMEHDGHVIVEVQQQVQARKEVHSGAPAAAQPAAC